MERDLANRLVEDAVTEITTLKRSLRVAEIAR
jgi:hypothetical protein